MADFVEKLRFVASGEDDMRSHAITAAADEIERLSAELAEWRKLRDPHTLHVNLLRGLPAQLTRPQVLHLIGDDVERFAEIEAENERLRAALREVLEFQSAPNWPNIHDWGRWRRLADRSEI